MNLLITGGAGFIGSNFVRFWNEQNPQDNLVIYDKLTYAGNPRNIADLLEKPNIKLVEADILDREALADAIDKNGIDLVVHFAAESHVDRSISAPDDFIQTNINGTFAILEELRQRPDVRLHHVSTDEVFGDLPLTDPDVKFTEETPYTPRSPYSASKAASDHLVRAYINTYGLQATISNCSNNYGPFCYPEKLIPLVITRALADEKIPVYGDGLQVRDWIHVRDHALGISLIVNHGKIGETYLLGGDGERKNIWMVEFILDYLKKPKTLIQHVGDRKGHDARYAIDFSKAKSELGYQPQKPVEDWLAETIDWYSDNTDVWRPLKPAADKIAERYLAQ